MCQETRTSTKAEMSHIVSNKNHPKSAASAVKDIAASYAEGQKIYRGRYNFEQPVPLPSSWEKVTPTSNVVTLSYATQVAIPVFSFFKSPYCIKFDDANYVKPYRN